MSTVQMAVGQKLLLCGVDWQTYRRLLWAFDERPGLRLTYDRGALEIMTLTHEHENDNRFLAQMVVVLTDELGLPLKQGGSSTFRRRRRRKGLEPDSCFWIVNEARVRGKRRINLRSDPPPDLALEIDIFHSSLDRFAIYAALGVVEVWRYSSGILSFHMLQANGTYLEGASRTFPGLNPSDLHPFLGLRDQMDENALMRQFRAWVRQHFATGGTSLPAP